MKGWFNKPQWFRVRVIHYQRFTIQCVRKDLSAPFTADRSHPAGPPPAPTVPSHSHLLTACLSYLQSADSCVCHCVCLRRLCDERVYVCFDLKAVTVSGLVRGSFSLMFANVFTCVYSLIYHSVIGSLYGGVKGRSDKMRNFLKNHQVLLIMFGDGWLQCLQWVREVGQ